MAAHAVARVRRATKAPAHGGMVIPAAGGSPAQRTEREPVRSQVVEIQRSRLLSATVRAVDELGYPRATVAHITRHARVSRRTFYELFANREEALLAVVDETALALEAELAATGIADLPWRERIHAGLTAILEFLDREHALARVCIVQALRAGPAVLERREAILARLTAVIDDGRREGRRGADLSQLTAEGLVGAALQILHTRLLRRDQESLSALSGQLMGMIVLPYLGPGAARRAQSQSAPAHGSPVQYGERTAHDPLEGLAMRMTYRTARVLAGIAEHPRANNRQVADYAGIHDQGQVSKLLARLERLGLLANDGEGHASGEPNAWALTDRGERVARSVRLHAPGGGSVAT